MKKYSLEKCGDNVLVFGVLGRTIEDADHLGLGRHRRKIIHGLFEQHFEDLLKAFLDKNQVTEEQFQEVLKMDEEEERVHGEHFHRWARIIDYEIFEKAFHVACTGQDDPVLLLRRYVQGLEAEAARVSSRQRVIHPLLDMWGLVSFQQVRSLLDAIETPRPTHSKEQKKELVRWSNKMAQPTLDEARGVYVDAKEKSLDEWVKYMLLWCEPLADAEFNLFIATLSMQLQLQAATAEGIMPPKRRHNVWRVFTAIDTHKTHSRIDFRLVVPHFRRFLEEHPERNHKLQKKALAKWISKTQQGEYTPHWITLPQLQDFVMEFEEGLPGDLLSQELVRIADHIQQVYA